MTDPKEAVDAAVDDTGGVHGRTSDDGDQEERAEV
jgi:hypothetical protein